PEHDHLLIARRDVRTEQRVEKEEKRDDQHEVDDEAYGSHQFGFGLGHGKTERERERTGLVEPIFRRPGGSSTRPAAYMPFFTKATAPSLVSLSLMTFSPRVSLPMYSMLAAARTGRALRRSWLSPSVLTSIDQTSAGGVPSVAGAFS